MNRYNSYMNNHFSACLLLTHMHDPHRSRDVRVHMIPGEFEIVGLTDGVDSWICPTSTPFMEKVRKILGTVRDGSFVRAEPRRRERRTVNVQMPLALPTVNAPRRERRVAGATLIPPTHKPRKVARV